MLPGKECMGQGRILSDKKMYIRTLHDQGVGIALSRPAFDTEEFFVILFRFTQATHPETNMVNRLWTNHFPDDLLLASHRRDPVINQTDTKTIHHRATQYRHPHTIGVFHPGADDR